MPRLSKPPLVINLNFTVLKYMHSILKALCPQNQTLIVPSPVLQQTPVITLACQERLIYKKKCSGCGSTAHGYPGSNDRTTKCPAKGKTCHNCQKLNHFANVCRQPVNVNGINLVAHVSYNDCDETFTVASTANNTEIPVSLTPIINNKKQQQSTQMLIYPDSSAQICLAGPKHIKTQYFKHRSYSYK